MRLADYPTRFSRIGVILGLLLLLFSIGGCGSLPIPTSDLEQPDSEWIWTDLEEVSTLKTLYDYTQRIRNLKPEELSQEYSRLSREEPEASELAGQNPLRRLRIALLLSQTDSAITDLNAALDGFHAVYEQVAHQPLLSSFVLQHIASLEQNQRLDAVLNRTRQRYRRLRAAYRTLQQQPLIAATLAQSVQQDAVTASDQGNAVEPDDNASSPPADSASAADSTPASSAGQQQSPVSRQQLEWELERLESELAELQRQLQQRDDTIAAQNDKIQELEAKIKALSAIELNLNNQQ